MEDVSRATPGKLLLPVAARAFYGEWTLIFVSEKEGESPDSHIVAEVRRRAKTLEVEAVHLSDIHANDFARKVVFSALQRIKSDAEDAAPGYYLVRWGLLVGYDRAEFTKEEAAGVAIGIALFAFLDWCFGTQPGGQEHLSSIPSPADVARNVAVARFAALMRGPPA